jgi:hypothetical protein
MIGTVAAEDEPVSQAKKPIAAKNQAKKGKKGGQPKTKPQRNRVKKGAPSKNKAKKAVQVSPLAAEPEVKLQSVVKELR